MFKPLTGALAAVLLSLAVQAGLIPLSVSAGQFGAYLLLAAFAVGFAERSIPDLIGRARLERGVAQGAGASSQRRTRA